MKKYKYHKFYCGCRDLAPQETEIQYVALPIEYTESATECYFIELFYDYVLNLYHKKLLPYNIENLKDSCVWWAQPIGKAEFEEHAKIATYGSFDNC